VVEHVQRKRDVSQRRVCRTLKQPRSTQRYEAKGPSSDERRLLGRIHELVRRHPRYGYRRIWALLRREGWRVNRKRIYRLWRQEGLKVPQEQRKKRHLGHSGNSCVRRRAACKDDVWAWDFVHDRTTSGRPLKWLAITDEYTRECLALEVDRSITAERMLDILTNLFMTRGVPRHIRSDNGPEFIARAIRGYLERIGVETLYIEPGSPWENGYAESFFSRLRDELLNCEEFTNLAEARWFARRRKEEHNWERPHSSLGYQTPAEFAAGLPASAPALVGPALQREGRLPETESTIFTQSVLS
jgi:putative transposase